MRNSFWISQQLLHNTLIECNFQIYFLNFPLTSKLMMARFSFHLSLNIFLQRSGQEIWPIWPPMHQKSFSVAKIATFILNLVLQVNLAYLAKNNFCPNLPLWPQKVGQNFDCRNLFSPETRFCFFNNLQTKWTKTPKKFCV